MAQYTRQQLLDAHNRAIAAQDFDAADELAGMIDAMAEEPVQEPDGPMLPNITGALERTGQRIEDIAEADYSVSPTRLLSEGIRGTGDILVGAFQDLTPDVLKDAVKSGVEGLTPAAKKVVEPVTKLATIVGETEIAQDILNTMQKSWSTHLARKEEDPEYAYFAREVEALVDVAAVVAPPTKIKPVLPESSGLANTGMGLVRGGRKQQIGKRKELVTEALKPLDGFGQGTTYTKGWLSKKSYDPSADELEMIDVVSSIPEFDPKSTFIDNYNVIEDYIGRQANQLKTGIAKAGNPQIDLDALVSDIRTRAMAGLEDEVYNRKGKARKIEEQLRLFVERAGKGTAIEVLEARQALDRALKKDQRSEQDVIATPSKAGRRAISEAVHDAIANNVPDVAVKDLLRKQALSYRALDVVDEKRRLEFDTVISRAGQNLSRAGVNLPKNPASQVATGYAAANIVQSGIFPYLAAAGATAGAVYGASKAAMSPATKKFVGLMINAMDKGIKGAKGNAELAAQLRADRAILVSVLQDTRFDEEEEEEDEVEKEPEQANVAPQQSGQAAQIANSIQNLRGFNQLPQQQVNARLSQLNDPLLQQAVMQQLYGSTP
jgi:hypothetical protein